MHTYGVSGTTQQRALRECTKFDFIGIGTLTIESLYKCLIEPEKKHADALIVEFRLKPFLFRHQFMSLSWSTHSN